MKGTGLGLVWFLFPVLAVAQSSVLGQWKTIDDESGEPRSVVEIFQKNGKLHGKIIKLFRKAGEDPDPVCDKCSDQDPRYKKKIIGMEILQGLGADGDEYAGGQILDPNNGKVYRCKVWLENGSLKLRGYIGPFFRTQTWLKFSN